MNLNHINVNKAYKQLANSQDGSTLKVKLKGKTLKNWNVYYKKDCDNIIEKVVERPDGSTVSGGVLDVTSCNLD